MLKSQCPENLFKNKASIKLCRCQELFPCILPLKTAIPAPLLATLIGVKSLQTLSSGQYISTLFIQFQESDPPATISLPFTAHTAAC